MLLILVSIVKDYGQRTIMLWRTPLSTGLTTISMKTFRSGARNSSASSSSRNAHINTQNHNEFHFFDKEKMRIFFFKTVCLFPFNLSCFTQYASYPAHTLTDGEDSLERKCRTDQSPHRFPSHSFLPAKASGLYLLWKIKSKIARPSPLL